MFNKVILIGHVGKDAQLKHLANDNTIATFTVATSESYKDKTGQWQNLTEWHNIVIFKASENLANAIKKGMQVAIEGKIKMNRYTNNEGIEKIQYQIICSNIKILSKKENNESVKPESKQEPSNETKDFFDGVIDDDLPF